MRSRVMPRFSSTTSNRSLVIGADDIRNLRAEYGYKKEGHVQSPKPAAQRLPVLIPRRKAPACIAKKRVERAAAGSRRLLLIMAKKCKSRLRKEGAQRGAFGLLGVAINCCGTPRPENVSTGGAKPAILVHVAHFIWLSGFLYPPYIPRADSGTEPTTPVYTAADTVCLCLRHPYKPVSIPCTYVRVLA